jgi:hypothetical protein
VEQKTKKNRSGDLTLHKSSKPTTLRNALKLGVVSLHDNSATTHNSSVPLD